MIVVDTNIICYFWIPGVKTQLAEGLMQKDPLWLVPVLWRSEFQNVLAGCLRRGDLTLTQVTEILESAESFFSGKEFFIPSTNVMKLVSESKCTAYDCEFVALAMQRKVHLITGDKAVLRDFPQVALKIDDFIKAGV